MLVCLACIWWSVLSVKLPLLLRTGIESATFSFSAYAFASTGISLSTQELLLEKDPGCCCVKFLFYVCVCAEFLALE